MFLGVPFPLKPCLRNITSLSGKEREGGAVDTIYCTCTVQVLKLQME